jgi:hypothetical protein
MGILAAGRMRSPRRWRGQWRAAKRSSLPAPSRPARKIT